MRARQPRTARPRMSARRRAPPASTQTTPRTDGTATRLEPANGTRGRGAHSARPRGEHRRESRGVRPRPSQAAPGKQGNLPGPLRRPRLEMSGGNGMPTRPGSTVRNARRKKTECRIQAELDGRAGGAESPSFRRRDRRPPSCAVCGQWATKGSVDEAASRKREQRLVEDLGLDAGDEVRLFDGYCGTRRCLNSVRLGRARYGFHSRRSRLR